MELDSRAGALKQMLLDLLEDPYEIRQICIMGRNCTVQRNGNDVECSVPLEKQIAEGTVSSFYFTFLILEYSVTFGFLILKSLIRMLFSGGSFMPSLMTSCFSVDSPSNKIRKKDLVANPKY